MKKDILNVNSEEELLICSKLREEVFGFEENAPETLYIIDEYDKIPSTYNYLLKADGAYVGTARFIKADNDTIKIQRMAVLKNFRKKGCATEILNFLEKDAKDLGYKKIIMDSALSAVEFYKKMGYESVSNIFYEDGRPHVKMEKRI